MKTIRSLLLLITGGIIASSFNPVLTFSQNNCVGPTFGIALTFTIPSANCYGSECILNIEQSNAKTKLIKDYKIKCTDSAAHVCVRKACPNQAECQVVINNPPSVYSEICSTDTAGQHWCSITVGGSYYCICVGNKVTITASNGTGYFCPGETLDLYAVTESPITNIDYIQWFVNDSIIEGADTTFHAVSMTGIYEVLIVDTDGQVYLSPPFPVACPASIPTLQEWVLAILGVLLLYAGTMAILRKKRRPAVVAS
ncbi:MAG TPA: hypothetical protein P5531_09995 [Bacteroidales bacterium]|nr:hypothetical protein [Bacteroidales bacterium]HSA43969.1 hypothetical protein [Bacteroidales bacterium]